MESTEKQKRTPQTAMLKKRIDDIEAGFNAKIDEMSKTVEAKNEFAGVLSELVSKVEALETSLSTLNVDGLKARLFNVEESTKKDIRGFKQVLESFSESFNKFKKVWGHNEEGITINDHFQGQNVEKPFIVGGPPVDEQGNKLEPKSKLQEQMIGDLPMLMVP